MELDLQICPEEIMSWAEQVGRLLLRVVQVVRQQQCNGHCLCDCPSTAFETTIAQCTSRWVMARGHRLNTFHRSGGGLRSLRSFSGGFRGRAFTLSSPSHSVPVPNKPSRFRGRKATIKQKELCESRGGRPGLSVVMSLTVSVDVKQH